MMPKLKRPLMTSGLPDSGNVAEIVMNLHTRAGSIVGLNGETG